MKSLKSFITESKNREVLIVTFNDQSEYLRAVDFYQDESDFTPDETDNKSKQIIFPYEDVLEKYLDAELRKNKFKNYSFTVDTNY